MYVITFIKLVKKKPQHKNENARVPREIVLCIGGWSSTPTGPCRHIETYNYIQQTWRSHSIQVPFSRAHHGLEVIGDKVYNIHDKFFFFS